MFLLNKNFSFLVLVVFLININNGYAKNFNDNLREIRAEINRDNLKEAIKLIKKIEISNENQQEKIDLLFGDIYLKINQIDKAEEYYQKNFFTSNEEIESLTFIGFAEVRLAQGKLDDAIKYAKQSIKINSNKIRPKIILAIALTRLGESEKGFDILNDLYLNRKDAEVALAISGYFSSFNETKKAIDILEEFIKRDPNNIKVLNELASLHLFDGNKEKAIEYKLIVYKYYDFNQNRKKQKQAKEWILSVDPKYFDKPVKIKKEDKKEQEEYQEEEITNYDNRKITPNYYEDFAFAPNNNGSGFIISEGKYVITNHHVIDGATKIAVGNAINGVTNANVVAVSVDYDLAILELEKPYKKKYAIKTSDFAIPKPGEDVISIGYPGVGYTYDQPTITQGIVSKVFDDNIGKFLTTVRINPGNSGGPIFNLSGQLIGVSAAMIDRKAWKEEYGEVITDMGIAIKSNMLKKVFKHQSDDTIKSATYGKASLYEKKLPSIVLVVTLKDQ